MPAMIPMQTAPPTSCWRVEPEIPTGVSSSGRSSTTRQSSCYERASMEPLPQGLLTRESFAAKALCFAKPMHEYLVIAPAAGDLLVGSAGAFLLPVGFTQRLEQVDFDLTRGVQGSKGSGSVITG